LNNDCADFVRKGDYVQAFQTSKKLLELYDVIDAGILTRARTRYLYSTMDQRFSTWGEHTSGGT
jgi:hypothetical protein